MASRRLLYLVGLLLSGFPSPAVPQTVQSVMWNTPDGDKPDLSQTFISGQSIPLSWNAANQTRDDLWLTTWDYATAPYSQLLTKNIDLSENGQYTWTIDIPSAQLHKSAKYVLRFKPPRADGAYAIQDTELSSPGFLVLQAQASETSTSSSTTSSRPTATGASQTSNPPSPGNEQANSPNVPTGDDGGLTGGAKAGIAIGAIAGVALIALAAWLFWRKRRTPVDGGDPMMAQLPPKYGGETVTPHELSSDGTQKLPPVELEGGWAHHRS